MTDNELTAIWMSNDWFEVHEDEYISDEERQKIETEG